MGSPDLDAFYKKKYGLDFLAMTEKQRVAADKALEAASAHPHVVINGQLQTNPIRQKIYEQGGFTPEQAKLLGIYAAYKSGMTPQALDRDRLKKAGVSEEDLSRIGKEREDSWSKDIENRFSHFVKEQPDGAKRKQPTKPAELTMEPEVLASTPKTDRGISKAKAKEGQLLEPQPQMPNPALVQTTPQPSIPVAGPGLPTQVAPVQSEAPIQAMPDPNATKWNKQILVPEGTLQ